MKCLWVIGLFPVFGYYNNTAASIYVQVFVDIYILSLGYISRSAMAIYLFKKLQDCFSKWLYHFTLPPAVCKRPRCPTPSSALGMGSLHFSHFIKSVIFFYVVWICISLMINTAHLFMCLFTISISYLVKCLNLLAIFYWVVFLLSFEGSLYIPHTSLFSDMWFANIFQPVTCLFIVFTVYFKVQKFLIWCCA